MHIRIDVSRFCLDCGMINRIYLRRDGCIVFSHDQHGYEGVHVLVPKKSQREYLAQKLAETLTNKQVWKTKHYTI